VSIKNIIFDVGGVFVKWDPKLVFRKYFNSEAEIDDFMKEIDFYGMNEKGDIGIETITTMIGQLSKEFPQYKNALLAYDVNWIDTIAFEYEGTRKLAQDLHKSGYKTYILSNWEGDKFRIFDSKYKLIEMVDGYVLSGDVRIVKPDPAIYKLLLDKYGLKASECVFLDDLEKNVEGAKNVGIEAFVFKSAAEAKKDLESLGVKIK
jgi:epoxide hydrolase-like predicted phosphatase